MRGIFRLNMRKGPIRDVVLLMAGLLAGATLVLIVPDGAPSQPIMPGQHSLGFPVKSLRQAYKQNAAAGSNASISQHETTQPIRSNVRPKTIAEELSTKKPLFIGVVTAEKFLNTRGKALYETWGKLAPNVAFFSSQSKTKQTLPVVSLPGVDDTYPPQKKVFRMLKYMHDHYIDEYSWFMRADDDVYVRVSPLIQLLNSLDPDNMVYMGQPGMGKPEDLERVKLHPYEHYCMGGTGVIYSRALLLQLAPHLEDCLDNVVVSYNEDLEVGRCISRKLDVQCTWSYELSRLFYMDYSKGEMFRSDAIYNDKKLPNALTVHSFKKSADMYKIHQYFIEVDLNKTVLENERLNKELVKYQKITKKTRAFTKD